MLIKEKDITSYQLLLIKQDLVLLWLVNLDFFSFKKKWVGRAMHMGNDTFYWDGLSVRLSSYGCTQEIPKTR